MHSPQTRQNNQITHLSFRKIRGVKIYVVSLEPLTIADIIKQYLKKYQAAFEEIENLASIMYGNGTT